MPKEVEDAAAGFVKTMSKRLVVLVVLYQADAAAGTRTEALVGRVVERDTISVAGTNKAERES
jgi:hypothetical protein